MSPIAADLRALLETEQEAAFALGSGVGAISAPEAQACLDALHFTVRWFCAGLGRHVRRPAKRLASDPGTIILLREQLLAAPTGVDRIRLITRTQRSVLARVESVLAGSLGPDLRTFLEQARAVLAQSIHCCEDAIVSLDRQREVRLDADR